VKRTTNDVQKLAPMEIFFSQRFQQPMASHSPWLETGYNYLAALRKRAPDQKNRRSEFLGALKKAAMKAGIQSKNVNEEFIQAVLSRIKIEFKV
jgi:hypothetical protein